MTHKATMLVVSIVFALGNAVADDAARGTHVLLWPNGAPQAKGSDETDKPSLTVLLPPKDKATGAGVIVNPGGAYLFLSSDHEGLQVAHWLNSVGIAAFVLQYRLKPTYDPSIALLDAQRAIRYVRSHPDELGVSPRRIGMLGFSAGGHLASAAGTQFDAGDANANDPIDRAGCRPDFLALIYPAINGELLNPGLAPNFKDTHTLVTTDTPPTFFVQTHEDELVTPNHSILFYQALLKAKVEAEMHIFGYGEHGLGLAPGDPDLAEWTTLFAHWLRRTGFLTDVPRTAVRGDVVIDGKPLFWGWITFIPDDPHAPIARANMGVASNGRFAIDEKHGPVSGKHHVEVCVVARGMEAPKAGHFSMDDMERYTHAKPGSADPIVVDVAHGQDVHIEIMTK